jgi:hypothetical protein
MHYQSAPLVRRLERIWLVLLIAGICILNVASAVATLLSTDFLFW